MEDQKLRHNKIKLVKVRWNAKLGPEYTWERLDQMKKKYPALFEKTPVPEDLDTNFGDEIPLTGGECDNRQ